MISPCSSVSVAGIPGFLEERAVFRKERANGLYGTLPFVLSNSLVNIPFLFFCSIVFILIMYWGVVSLPSLLSSATGFCNVPTEQPYSVRSRGYTVERQPSSATSDSSTSPSTALSPRSS
jgi:hypothetical protein